MPGRLPHLETKLIHAGEPQPRILGAVSLPVFQSTVYEYEGQTSYHDLRYIRLNNLPNHLAVGKKLAAVENAEAAVVTASGMAAISTALLAVLRAGDHLLIQGCLYGGTHTLVTRHLETFGIGHDFLEGDDPAAWRPKLRPRTKAIYVETMTNPLLQVIDLQAVVSFAQDHRLVSMIDNTLASPVNFRPSEWGFDLSLHSCTKYLNGHSDIVAGAVIGRADLVEEVTHKLNHLGGSLDPHACWLLHRGMKTLALRVQRQNETALRIARLLSEHPEVLQVNYPALESHPDHPRAARLFDGCGGVLSFELEGGAERADRFIERCHLAISAPSLGGVETLITRPAATSHSSMSRPERLRAGVTDSLVRLSVGIESADDLAEDLIRALGESREAPQYVREEVIEDDE